MEAPAVDAPNMEKIFFLMAGLIVAVAGTSTAALSFAEVVSLQNEAEDLENELAPGGRPLSCTESWDVHGPCVSLDQLDADADFAIALGVAALFGGGIGMAMALQQVRPTSSPAKSPGPLVSFTKVPGGGMVTVMGVF
jgi:hypothetical protein